MLLAEDGVEPIDSEIDDIGLLSGTIGVATDTSQVANDPAAEEFIVGAQCKSLEDSNFVARGTRKTLSELREMYPDKEKELDSIVTTKTWKWKQMKRYSLNMKALIWAQATLAHMVIKTKCATSYSTKLISCWIQKVRASLSFTEIVKAGNVILDKEQVDRRPFCRLLPYLPLILRVTSQTNYARRNARTAFRSSRPL